MISRYVAGAFIIASVAVGQEQRPVRIMHSLKNDTTPPLRSLPVIEPRQRTEWENGVIPNTFDALNRAFDQNMLEQQVIDPALQSWFGTTAVNVPLVNFEGVGNLQSVYPPDPNGDVGVHHYIQMVNSSFAIYGKSGNLLYGPVDNSTLWQGFTGPWTGTNDGDPIVLYDPLAGRWLTSQFAIPSQSGPYYELIAISQSDDPLGSWNRYAFEFDDLPDYPKIGVWPDAYYLSVVSFHAGVTFTGPGVAALDRDAMLQGDAATMQFIQLATSETRMLPGDLDGPAPPAGAPNYFARLKDNIQSGGVDRLGIFEFHVDWDNPGNTTFTGPSELPTLGFDIDMCGLSRNCIQQPSTSSGLDALSDRLLYRLQYRNFGSYQTLVTNHTVDVDGTDRAGIRWYELRNAGSGWSIFQQGTYSPDATNRWMGSIAMNGNGDIALGFSVSDSTSVYPSIRYTGRLSGDPQGQMTVAEQTIINGSGVQTGNAHRWGDYSMMAVDPVDERTFWYTIEYIVTSGTSPWQTRIASFDLSPTAVPALAYVSTSVSGGNGNGVIEYNECNDLNFTIRNDGGATASGISASLETSTPGVMIVQNVSTFQNIPTGSSAATETPFQINTAPDFVCGTPIVLNLMVSFTGGNTDVFPVSLQTCICTPTVIPGSITGGDPTQTKRISRNGTTSTCASPKTCPGSLGTGPFAYDAYPFTNADAFTQCYTVSLQQDCAAGGDLLCSAYNDEFDPTNVCTNYLADMGGSGPDLTMSFTVPAGGTFVVVVTEVTEGAGCSSYTLNVTAGNCGSDGGGECAALPIQLASWTATVLDGGDVILRWTTLSEVNNYGFEIQRSAGEVYTTLPGVFIPGNGTTNTPHQYAYRDTNAARGGSYRLKQIDLDGTTHMSEVIFPDALTDVVEPTIPQTFALEQNYPNPFNPSTTIRYALPWTTHVRLEILNTLGQRVALPVDATQPAGYHQITIDEPHLSSGVYFYRLQVEGNMLTRRMILLR